MDGRTGISTGAQNDLQQITKTAYAMVTIYGMNEKVGNISFYDPQQENAFTKPYSEETSKLIDQEVRKLIDDAYDSRFDAYFDEALRLPELDGRAFVVRTAGDGESNVSPSDNEPPARSVPRPGEIPLLHGSIIGMSRPTTDL